MIPAVIFQDLEYLNEVQTSGYGDHFVFQSEGKIYHRQNICRPGLHIGWFYILNTKRDTSGHFSMLTPFGFQAGSNSTLGKYSQAMTSYKLFSHSQTLVIMIREI